MIFIDLNLRSRSLRSCHICQWVKYGMPSKMSGHLYHEVDCSNCYGQIFYPHHIFFQYICPKFGHQANPGGVCLVSSKENQIEAGAAQFGKGISSISCTLWSDLVLTMSFTKVKLLKCIYYFSLCERGTQ